jgi:hypothetical protein
MVRLARDQLGVDPVTVVEATSPDVIWLRQAGAPYIAGARLQDWAVSRTSPLPTPSRMRQVEEGLRVKEVGADNAGCRQVVCHDAAQARRDQAAREQVLQIVDGHLAHLGELWPEPGRLDLTASRQAYDKARRELVNHPTWGSWVRTLPNGRLVMNQAAIAAQARLDGLWLLSTTSTQLSADEVGLAYRNTMEAQRGFQELRLALPLTNTGRGRALMALCWLALLLIRIAERSTGLVWPDIRSALDQCHAVTMVGPAGTQVRSSRPTPDQATILAACGVPPPGAVLDAG